MTSVTSTLMIARGQHISICHIPFIKIEDKLQY